jgi:hypothetical protein
VTLRCVRDLLTKDEVAAIENAPLIAGSMRHPTWSPISENQNAVDQLTNKSVFLVADTGDTAWLQALAPRLVRIKGPSASLA